MEYQKELIESLSRSEREAKNKYLALQKRIESSESNETTVQGSRGVDDVLPQAPPPYTVNTVLSPTRVPNQPPPGKEPDSNPLVGELILCFNMVHNLLTQHLTLVSNATQYKTYTQLRKTIESANEAELDWLEEKFGEGAFQIGIEAARNAVHLQSRLRELANTHRKVAMAVKIEQARPRLRPVSYFGLNDSSSSLSRAKHPTSAEPLLVSADPPPASAQTSSGSQPSGHANPASPKNAINTGSTSIEPEAVPKPIQKGPVQVKKTETANEK
jgi:hypothetical protein